VQVQSTLETQLTASLAAAPTAATSTTTTSTSCTSGTVQQLVSQFVRPTTAQLHLAQAAHSGLASRSEASLSPLLSVLRAQLPAAGAALGLCGDTVSVLTAAVQKAKEGCRKADSADKPWAVAAGEALVKDAAQVGGWVGQVQWMSGCSVMVSRAHQRGCKGVQVMR
jgi:hypothetical protein